MEAANIKVFFVQGIIASKYLVSFASDFVQPDIKKFLLVWCECFHDKPQKYFYPYIHFWIISLNASADSHKKKSEISTPSDCQSKSYGQNINVAPGTKKHQVSGSWGKQKKITRPAVRKIWPGIPTPGKSLNLEDCSFVL